ncbi:hypothetical protein ACP70R_015874 [Stipagrostis hirtigluma subsp. patula]
MSEPAPPLPGDASHSRAEQDPSDWALLYRFPFVVGAGDLSGADFDAALDLPPRPSYIAIKRSLLPDPEKRGSFSFLHGIDATGRFLLISATQGPGTERLMVLEVGSEVGSGRAVAIPSVPSSLGVELAMRECIGVMADPRSDGGYMVAQLRFVPVPSTSAVPAAAALGTAPSAPTATATLGATPSAPSATSTLEAAPSATSTLGATPSAPSAAIAQSSSTTTSPSTPCCLVLLCFTSSDKSWTVKHLATTSDVRIEFHVDRVICNDMVLAFVDHDNGVLLYDPTSSEDDVLVVPLPSLDADEHLEASSMGIHRCVSESEHLLHFVLIHDTTQEVTISTWFMDLVDKRWIPEHKVPFREIWEHETYHAAGLPLGEIPAVGVLDPKDANIIFLIAGTSVFSVHLPSCQTLECASFFMDVKNEGWFSSLDICSWVFPKSHIPSQQSETSKSEKTSWKALKAGGKSVRRMAMLGWRYTLEKKKYIEIIPETAGWAGLIFGSICPHVSAATRIITYVGTKAVEAINFAETIERLRSGAQHTDEVQLTTVGDEQEALAMIQNWNALGQPKWMCVEFPYDMTAADQSDLRLIFTERDAESMLWLPELKELIKSYVLL